MYQRRTRNGKMCVLWEDSRLRDMKIRSMFRDNLYPSVCDKCDDDAREGAILFGAGFGESEVAVEKAARTCGLNYRTWAFSWA
jgi:hypothetical protein